LVSDGYGQGIAALKQAQQSNLVDNLDQCQHRAPRASGPMPPTAASHILRAWAHM
jgi:hypothetical protein